MSTGASAEPQRRFGRRVDSARRVARRLRSVLAASLAVVGLAGAGLMAVEAAGVGASPALAGGPLINGGGSSYASPALNQWAAEVQTYYGSVVNYNVSSSVIGLNEFAQNQLDFGASEIGYSTGQAQSVPSEKYQYLPDVAGATCLMYNLHGVTGAPITVLRLTAQLLALIFTGQVKYWNAPQIEALNPGVLLPHEPIIVVWRSDASGDNYLFSEYINFTEGGIWNAFSKAMGYNGGAEAVFPFPQNGGNPKRYNLTGWVGAQGSDIASNDVAQQEGAITYVETAYAYLHDKPCGYVRNRAGNYVEPSEVADSTALEGATLLPDLEQKLDGVYTNPQPATYPISAYSYLITQEATEQPEKGAVLGQFISFLACQGQEAAGQLGYAPLPPNLVQDDFNAIDRIHGAARAPAHPTAENCKNPYVDGQTPLPGEPHVVGQKGGGGTGNSGTGGGSSSSGGSTGTGGGTATGGASSHGGKRHGKTRSGGSVTTTTLPAGVLGSGSSQSTATSVPGLKLLLAVNQLQGSEGISGASVGSAIGITLAVLVVPAVLLGRRRRHKAGEPKAGEPKAGEPKAGEHREQKPEEPAPGETGGSW